MEGYDGPEDRTKGRIKGCQVVSHSDGKKWPNKHAHCALVPGGLIIQKTEEMFEAK